MTLQPFVRNPLGGILGIRQGTIYELDETGTVPIASLGELINPYDKEKFGMDVTESEDFQTSYTVTTHALQDFSDATTNVHKELQRVTVSGIVSATLDIYLVGSAGVPGVPGFGGGFRGDLIKLENLRRIADRREPVMYVSPRRSLAAALIEDIGESWTSESGEMTQVTFSLVEARIVNPLAANEAIPDVANSATGNNEIAAQGRQAVKNITTQTVTPPGAYGLPPTVIPFV